MVCCVVLILKQRWVLDSGTERILVRSGSKDWWLRTHASAQNIKALASQSNSLWDSEERTHKTL